MNCREVEKLVLSEFIDGETQKEISDEVLSHLNSCPVCKNFYDEVMSSTVDPFSNSSLIKAPAAMWDEIEKRIESAEIDKQKSGFFNLHYLLKEINTFYSSARRVSAFASVVFIFVIFVFFFNIKQKAYKATSFELQHEKEFHYILSRTRLDLAEEDPGFGTSIEKLFL